MNAITQPASPAGIGHNSGDPAPLAVIDLDKLRAGLTDRYMGLAGKVEAHEAAQERFSKANPKGIDDEDTAGRIADWIKQITGLSSTLDDTRKAEKASVLEAGRTIDGFFGSMGERLAQIKAGGLKALTDYSVLKAERRRAELAAEAKRQAAEAERLAAQAEVQQSVTLEAEAVAAEQRSVDLQAAAASAPVAELSRTRGDFGSTSSVRTTWTYEIDDISKVPTQYLMLNEPMVRAAIKTALKLKGVPQITIPGLRIVSEQKAVVR